MRSRVLTILILMVAIPCATQQAGAPKWTAWNEFLGTWRGAGSGDPGQGSGEFSFLPELQGEVLVRHNYAAYPATKDEPAYRHDDLMIVYQDGAGTRADYWDNEVHVIHYTAELSEGGRKLQFVSDPVAGQSRYRLTYAKTAADELKLTSEIAPANAQDDFKTYIQASAKRVK